MFIKKSVFVLLLAVMVASLGLAVYFGAATQKLQEDVIKSDPEYLYTPLDVNVVRVSGYEGHHEKNCAYGAFNAIIEPLQEEFGDPYDRIPSYMLTYGGGGVRGEESACGALLGALSAINLVAGDDFARLADQLIDYYKSTAFPTDIANQYAEDGLFPNGEIHVALEQSTVDTINCDMSKQVWLNVTAYPQYRAERCSRLTSDIAVKTAEILNAWYLGEEPIDPQQEFALIFEGAQFQEIDDVTYEAVLHGDIVGYIGLATGIGSIDAGSHEIVLAVGIDLEGVLQGVRVIDQSETPAYAQAFTEESWLSQFEGLSNADEVRLKANEGKIDVIAGATQTCQAATSIVRRELERLQGLID